MHNDNRPVVVLGELDGFHLGHRQLVHMAGRVARAQGRGLVAAVMDVPASGPHLMLPVERCRSALANGCSAAHVITVGDATDAGGAAEIVELLIHRFQPSCVVMACPPDISDRPRHPALASQIRAHGIELTETERWLDIAGYPITSTRIAALLRAGDVSRAHDWIGAPYAIDGIVVHGSGLGRTIGFPTANLDPPADRTIPARGVYAAIVTLDDRSRHRAAVNIGVRPTVEQDGRLLVEAHLLDFDGDLYDRRIRVSFRHWLRGEHRFRSVDTLVAQLDIDTLRTRLSTGG